ncbi:MAG: LAGLIDADG family homing endonuclease [Candidatus Portnoybacteria bacterium]|nr:LAGLIDADG family homing endonuclease [Candidatus Portnoybacteria bacterium]
MKGNQKNKNYIIKWTSEFAYAIGLLTADGCLSSDGRHLNLTSKDKEQVENFITCLGLTNKIGKKAREKKKIKKYYQVQFGNVKLYKFLKEIGLTPRKSLTLKEIKIPIKFFSDFLRGLFDGDGTFGVFKHPESQYPQLRLRFASASPQFIRWLHREIKKELDTKGFIANGKRDENLTYGISDSLKLLNYMYYSPNVICLSRKFQKAKPYFKRT